LSFIRIRVYLFYYISLYKKARKDTHFFETMSFFSAEVLFFCFGALFWRSDLYPNLLNFPRFSVSDDEFCVIQVAQLFYLEDENAVRK